MISYDFFINNKISPKIKYLLKKFISNCCSHNAVNILNVESTYDFSLVEYCYGLLYDFGDQQFIFRMLAVSLFFSDRYIEADYFFNKLNIKELNSDLFNLYSINSINTLNIKKINFQIQLIKTEKILCTSSMYKLLLIWRLKFNQSQHWIELIESILDEKIQDPEASFPILDASIKLQNASLISNVVLKINKYHPNIINQIEINNNYLKIIRKELITGLILIMKKIDKV